jgi:hypothetical protein
MAAAHDELVPSAAETSNEGETMAASGKRRKAKKVVRAKTGTKARTKIEWADVRRLCLSAAAVDTCPFRKSYPDVMVMQPS